MRKIKARVLLIVSISNFIVILLMVIVLFNYANNQKRLNKKENKNTISILSKNITDTINVYFNDKNQYPLNRKAYINKSDLTFEEVLSYLEDSNNADKTDFHLINCSTKMGYWNEDGITRESSYSSYIDISKICVNTLNNNENNDIRITPSFTNPANGLQSIGFHTDIEIESQKYLIMCIVSIDDFIAEGMPKLPYANSNCAIIDKDGNYIIKEASFKSENIFEFFRIYNELTPNELNDVTNKVYQNESGIINFQDARKQDCLFVYHEIEGLENWYTFFLIPNSSIKETNIDIVFTLLCICFILSLVIIDGVTVVVLNLRLKRSYESEKEARLEAEEANNAKSDFLSKMSHDLRTPINAIIGMAELGKDDADKPDVILDYLEKIDSSCHFLLSIISDILDVSKIESGKLELHPEPYSYYEFINNLKTLFEPLCTQKNITLTFHEADTKNTVLIDKIRFIQIFFNILSNSVKFTGDGGKIDFIMNSFVDDNYVKCDFSIIDTGVGMSDEFQERMFLPFSRENNAVINSIQGTGLGLMIVKNLVEQMDGSIAVRSKLGKGTEMMLHFDLPIVSDDEKTQNAKQYDSESINLAGIKVLLVDDHPLNIEVAKKLLNKKNAVVECAFDGQEVLDAFKNSEMNHFDVILMDIRMPNMNGYEATKAIRALEREDAKMIPIIAMTANAFHEDEVQALEAGMNAHIAKPVNPKFLFETICELTRNVK